MSVVPSDLKRVVDKYLAGGQSFWDFHAEFMEVYLEAERVDVDETLWGDVYDLVYMGGPDPVPPEDHALGILGERELKATLRELRARIA